LRTPSTGNFSLPEDAREPVDADRPEDARATTQRNVKGRPAPRLPHERDESADSGTGAPSDVIQRAHDDVESGKAPTDKSEATDAVYEHSLRGTTPGAERD
jgi:hypothetical protein